MSVSGKLSYWIPNTDGWKSEEYMCCSHKSQCWTDLWFLPDLTLNFFKSQMKAFSNKRSQNMRPMYRGWDSSADTEVFLKRWEWINTDSCRRTETISEINWHVSLAQYFNHCEALGSTWNRHCQNWHDCHLHVVRTSLYMNKIDLTATDETTVEVYMSHTLLCSSGNCMLTCIKPTAILPCNYFHCLLPTPILSAGI